MSFINEFISDEDRENHNIDEIDKKFIVGGVAPRDWTVDKKINSFLRLVARGREEDADFSTWIFYFKSTMYVLEVHTLMHPITDPRYRYEVKSAKFISDVSDNIFDEVCIALKDAFHAYKDNGLFSTAETYKLKLDII